MRIFKVKGLFRVVPKEKGGEEKGKLLCDQDDSAVLTGISGL